ncbi:MAG: PhoH family protein [Promethearchaeota archaeon]|jgi:phosphate starvation-inducible PhoH-like protein
MPKKISVSSTKTPVSAKNSEQKDMLRTISQNDITFVKGAPGSGKTYLAVGFGLQALLREDYEQLIFTRPVIEAGGEKLGFLPGNMYEKIDPYMIPIFETLSKLLPQSTLNQLMPKNGNGNGNGLHQSPIRVLPLAYMRGVTFTKSFIICDEMQNSTPEQMRMLLTRLGESSRMVLCGDVYQTDIGSTNGLYDAFELLSDIPGIGFVTLTQEAIMRHPIIQEIENRYLSREPKKKNKR